MIAWISTYIPQKCGLATYTHHLRSHVKAARGGKGFDPVVVLTDHAEYKADRDPALWPLQKQNRSDYVRMAHKINRSGVSVVSLQHEFGIFGGEAGAYVLDLVEALEKPLVTTFHTVFAEPGRAVQKHSAKNLRSQRPHPGHEQGSGRLLEPRFRGAGRESAVRAPRHAGSPSGMAKHVAQADGLGRPEGHHDFRFAEPRQRNRIRAAGAGVDRQGSADVLYAIVGQTHPTVKKHEGEAYREQLQEMVRRFGLEDHVVMLDRYLEEDELAGLITACDLYITPYPGMQQITSGTLAYAVGLGRPVLSTPYSYARDLLRAQELLIPYHDIENWAQKMSELLSDSRKRKKWEHHIRDIGRSMHWAGSRTAACEVV